MKLVTLERVEQEHPELRARGKLELTSEDRGGVAQLSRNVPHLWSAATTTMAQRKTMVRTPAYEVCLTPISAPERGTQVKVLWSSGRGVNCLLRGNGLDIVPPRAPADGRRFGGLPRAADEAKRLPDRRLFFIRPLMRTLRVSYAWRMYTGSLELNRRCSRP